MKLTFLVTAFLSIFLFENFLVTAAELTCYKCSGDCNKQEEIKCSDQQNICVHFVYNDGDVEKGCMIEENYKKGYDDRNSKKMGLDKFTYKCEENLCNNKSLQDEACSKERLKCVWCRDGCENSTVRVCTEKQDRCYHFVFKSGYIQKGCVIESNYENVFEKANKRRQGLKDGSYRCEGNFCNVQNID